MNYLAPNTIGPVWPAMLICSLYMLAVTGFIVAAQIRLRSRPLSPAEHHFFHRLYDATEMVGAFALVCGLLGACAGLLEALPALAAYWQQSRNLDLLQAVLPPLRHVPAALFAGLLLGGLWRELLLFLLKPYTRPLLMPLHDDPSADEPFPFEDPLPAAPGAAPKPATPPDANGLDIADDWREMDAQGIY